MTAVMLEADARAYYQLYDHITTMPKQTEREYWCTLICPIDGTPYGHTGDNEKENRKEFLQSQGYLLSSLAEYIRDKTGIKIGAGDILKARSYLSKPTISGILMKAFSIPEDEFDMHFRLWCIDNRNRFKISIETDNQKAYKDPQYPVYELVPGSHVHFSFATQGKYSAPVRHVHTTKELCAMLMIPDADAGKMTSFNLSPAGNVIRTKKGTYEEPVIVPQTGLASNQDHCYIEIYGNTNSKTFGDIGYTVWTIGAVLPPKLSSDDTHLFATLPELMDPEKEGLFDGMIITVKKEGGKEKEYAVEPKDFGKRVSIPLSAFRSTSQEACDLVVTVKECVLSNKDERLYMPESKPVSISIAAKEQNTRTADRLFLTTDNLTEYDEQLMELEDADFTITWDPRPRNNSVTISGNKITVELGELNWQFKAVPVGFPNGATTFTYARKPLMLIGTTDNETGSGLYRLSSDPGKLIGRHSSEGNAVYQNGDKVEYISEFLEDQKLLEDIDMENSVISVSYENGEISMVNIQLIGTCTTKRTETYDGETKVNAGEEACSVRFNLEQN